MWHHTKRSSLAVGSLFLFPFQFQSDYCKRTHSLYKPSQNTPNPIAEKKNGNCIVSELSDHQTEQNAINDNVVKQKITQAKERKQEKKRRNCQLTKTAWNYNSKCNLESYTLSLSISEAKALHVSSNSNIRFIYLTQPPHCQPTARPPDHENKKNVYMNIK